MTVPADNETDCDASGDAVLTAGWARGLSERSEDPAAILTMLRAELGLDWETPGPAEERCPAVRGSEFRSTVPIAGLPVSWTGSQA